MQATLLIAILALLTCSSCGVETNESASDAAPASTAAVQKSLALLGPAQVTVAGHEVRLRRRDVDGQLTAERRFVCRGVVWSPSDRSTLTSPTDPNNAAVRRAKLYELATRDARRIASLGANCVRIPIDPGIDEDLASGLAAMDALYMNGLMVIFNADNGVGDADRAARVAAAYRDHPALLAYVVGSEWTENLFFRAAVDLTTAARLAESAIRAVKSADPDHPVISSVGDIDTVTVTLTTMAEIVSRQVPSADIWSANVFRGSSFGSLFAEWRKVTDKPLLIAEFGTDSFRSDSLASPPQGRVDEAAQAEYAAALWQEIQADLSAAPGVTIGGTYLELIDKWWMFGAADYQDTDGFPMPGASDGFSNEEYYGLYTADGTERQAAAALRAGWRRDSNLGR